VHRHCIKKLVHICPLQGGPDEVLDAVEQGIDLMDTSYVMKVGSPGAWCSPPSVHTPQGAVYSFSCVP
jgi:hypothetical protein